MRYADSFVIIQINDGPESTHTYYCHLTHIMLWNEHNELIQTWSPKHSHVSSHVPDEIRTCWATFGLIVKWQTSIKYDCHNSCQMLFIHLEQMFYPDQGQYWEHLRNHKAPCIHTFTLFFTHRPIGFWEVKENSGRLLNILMVQKLHE